MTVLALTGGVGGAKLALGLYKTLPAENLVCLVNTADDFEYLGLSVSPDLDSLMYALADEHNQKTGWGRRDETWQFKHALQQYGQEPWFALGDRDLATHVLRTQALKQGSSLTDITKQLSQALSVRCQLLPMTEAQVDTIIATKTGELSFQDYFVRQKCAPEITGIRFAGIEKAPPNPAVITLLEQPLDCIILCPSNPYVSMAPILQLPEMVAALKANGAPVVAVSPIIGGQAIKGPAAKMMQELNVPVTASAVAGHYVKQYPGLVSAFILDQVDAQQIPEVTALGLDAIALPTLMVTLADRQALAQALLNRFVRQDRRSPGFAESQPDNLKS